MSIQSEIERLQRIKEEIKEAIADKGVTVPAGSMLGDCPNLISSISSGGIIKDTVKINNITHKLFFFAGFVFSENLKCPVDLNTHTFYPNDDSSNLADYGYLYDYAARNALRANINSIGVEWGKWAILANSGNLGFSYDILNLYTLQEKLDAFYPQYAGLRNSDGTYVAFGSSMCLGFGNTDESYCDVTRNSFSQSMPTGGGRSFSLRMILLKK